LDTFKTVTLREATCDDAPTIVAVLQAAFEEYRGRLDPPSGAHRETVEKVRDVMRTARAVLALDGDQVAGCVFYASEDEHIDLFRLAVLPTHRRRGVGCALVEYVESRALALGIPRVQLGVRVALPRNRAYYERMGYRFLEARTHEGYAKPTYAILVKTLTERVKG
jgi:ribosomal protein S18 acetylase RimI-like enzyme